MESGLIREKGKAGHWFDLGVLLSLKGIVILVIGIVLLIGFILLHGSVPVWKQFGFAFLLSRDWDPIAGAYGALPFVVGTLVTSLVALLISLPFALSIALALGEFFPRGRVSTLLTSLVELMAGIPSVIYGFWALFYLVPLVRYVEEWMGHPPIGVGIFSAALILAIMIIPYSASVAREVIRMVPRGLKEAAYALGATRFEVVRDVVLPVGRSGIFAGILLSLGRALGETMAVTMVIGNSNFMPESIFSPANTIASAVANGFAEADELLHLSALVTLALVLFMITGIINMIGKSVIRRLAP